MTGAIRRALGFPSAYGQHALDADGRCHTRDPEDYEGLHREPEEEESNGN